LTARQLLSSTGTGIGAPAQENHGRIGREQCHDDEHAQQSVERAVLEVVGCAFFQIHAHDSGHQNQRCRAAINAIQALHGPGLRYRQLWLQHEMLAK
jgi:hypothetical protein